ncbi:MAG: glycosyltransferase family 2 protein [Syntrophales bacterium]
MDTSISKICAVILNIADTRGLVECLRSLDKTVYQNLEVIVVHNGPRDGGLEKEVLRAYAKISEVVFTGSNMGFAAGNNEGIKRALKKGAEYILLLNDDTTVAPDFIELLVAEALKDPAIGMLGPRIFYFSEPEKISFSGAKFNRVECAFSFPGAEQIEATYGHHKPEATDYVTGCALLVSRKLVETIGLLDERFFLYWEDSDWGLRAGVAGFKSVVVPSAKIWHKISVSSGGNDSALKAYYKTRGHFLFAGLHAPQAKKKVLLGIMRDIAWLLFKSSEPGKIKKSAARFLASIHYLEGRTGIGPDWIGRR